jgi:hypothetical protein
MSSSLDTRKLQFIDRWVGIPVCGVLNLVRLLAGGRRLEALTGKTEQNFVR